MCEQCTRRQFIGTGAAAGGFMLAGAALGFLRANVPAPPSQAAKP